MVCLNHPGGSLADTFGEWVGDGGLGFGVGVFQRGPEGKEGVGNVL